MDIQFWFFICSGLFLGWSLGANHAVNVFGTAVTSGMLKFRNAVIIGGIFTIIGALLSGGGTTETITNLGSVNAIAGSFTVALSVGIAITWMTKLKLPVSTSQAVIGAIVGWNIFVGQPTDISSLTKIVLSWVLSPVIAGVFAYLLIHLVKVTILKWKIHLLRLDNYTRIGLIIVGALASYSLGANNIANVMGMFVASAELEELVVFGSLKFSGIQQLFLLGGASIAFGMISYGKKVMDTVGKDLYKISPITGFVVVLAEFLVLMLFTSKELESLLLKLGLPTFPLVPLSTTQAFIGAVIGAGLAKDPLSINFRVFRKIAAGWVVAPVLALVITFVLLFFVQNVFEQKIVYPVPYKITESILEELSENKIETNELSSLLNKTFYNKKEFKNELLQSRKYTNTELFRIFELSKVDTFVVDASLITQDIRGILTDWQYNELKSLEGIKFTHRIDFEKALFANDTIWLYNIFNEEREAKHDLFTNGEKGKQSISKLQLNQYEEKKNILINLFKTKKTKKN